jgi:hypothetical protein
MILIVDFFRRKKGIAAGINGFFRVSGSRPEEENGEQCMML